MQKIALIVEDHPIVSESLTTLIHSQLPDFNCHSVTTGHDGLAFLNGNKPAIILLDINLPDISGIEFCQQATTRFPGMHILVITSIEQRHVVEQALQNGALGFILKSSDTEEIVEAIQQVVNGNQYVSPLVEALLKGKSTPVGNLPVLTRREIEVLRLIADGHTNQEIADKLFISSWTVDTHRKNLLVKFNAKNTAILIKTAAAAGLLDF
ncbi:MAG: response regulator transcription factor [Bacteroidetes bacterium]|nr:response regulator transcription factor [Bacteroidota bacterium]